MPAVSQRYMVVRYARNLNTNTDSHLNGGVSCLGGDLLPV